MFHLAPSTDATGITTMREIDVAPASLVRRFGWPAISDGYKVSGQYVFADQAGQPYVVHDWKSTSLWEADFPTPDEFWTSDEPQEFCIATRDLDAVEFADWLLEQLR